jgi:hypothetical protein
MDMFTYEQYIEAKSLFEIGSCEVGVVVVAYA